MTFEQQIEYNADCLIKLGKERWLKARRNPKRLKAYMHEVEQQERLLEIEERRINENQE